MTRRQFLLTLTLLPLAGAALPAPPQGAHWLPVARWVGQWFDRNPQERRVSIQRQGRLYRAQRAPGGWELIELLPDGRRLVRHTKYERRRALWT